MGFGFIFISKSFKCFLNDWKNLGKVEWYHDVNETELRARVSAGLCYVYLSEDSKFFLHKTANKKINE